MNLSEPILLTLSTLDPRYKFHFCYRRGEACAKAKRDALALAEAVADAHASANPEAIAEPNAEAGEISPSQSLDMKNTDAACSRSEK